MKERKVKITNIDQILRDEDVPLPIYNLCSDIKGLNTEIYHLKQEIEMHQNIPTFGAVPDFDDYIKEKIDTLNKEINDKKIEVKQKRNEINKLLSKVKITQELKELLSHPLLNMRP